MICSRYTLPNMTSKSKKLTSSLYKTIAENCESLAILIIGVSFCNFVRFDGSVSLYAVVSGFIILLVARFFNVFISACIVNVFKIGSIRKTFRFILWFSGLRGAMGNISYLFKFPILISLKEYIILNPQTCSKSYTCFNKKIPEVKKYNFRKSRNNVTTNANSKITKPPNLHSSKRHIRLSPPNINNL